MLKSINKQIYQYTAYFNILYFIEIIYLMFLLLVIYGKLVSVITGAVLSVLLCFQIVNIYYGNWKNRKIQLYLMDFHLAWSVPYFFNQAALGVYDVWLDYIFVSTRIIIVIFEAFLIYFLTDDNLIEMRLN